MTDERFTSDLERRALANVPRYRQPGEKVDVAASIGDDGKPKKLKKVAIEDHLRDANGYPADWEFSTSITATELRKRLERDPHSPSPAQDELETVLVALHGRGYVDRAGDAVSMTEAGLAALTS